MDKVEDISKNIENFLNFMREVPETLHIAYDEMKYNDEETQDILHSLELEEHNYHEYAKMAKELARIRNERRVAKDNIKVLEGIAAWKEDNKSVLKSLEILLGKERKVEKSLTNRVYIKRT